MSNFEKIVRPFETGSPFTSRRLAPVPPAAEDVGQEPEPNPVMEWGGEHPGNWDNVLRPAITGWVKKYSETERKTSQVRVYQNNDENSSNYVDVERIDLLKLRSNDGDEIEWKGNWE